MARRIDLADPDFEPSDEELHELMSGAFADVAASHRAALEKMRREIAERQREVMSALGERLKAST